MNNQKTSTSLRIGISIAMIILMLGLVVFFNMFTTNTITNQMKTLSDFNIPMTQGVSKIYTIQQMQYQSYDDIMTYQKINNLDNYKFSKNQFDSYDNQFHSQIRKIEQLTVDHLNYELDEDVSRGLSSIITNLTEIDSIHSQYVQIANQIFESQKNNNVKNTDTLQTELEFRENQLNLKIFVLEDSIQKITNTLQTIADDNKQKTITLETVIIISAGILSLALGYFLNLINKDLVQEVIKRTRSLQKANRKLEKTNVLKDDFINIASHELKSPLHPIHGFIELAQSGDISMEEALQGISKQARQLEEVANRILDMSKIENEILQLSYEKCDFSNSIFEIISSYRSNKKIKIETNLEKDIHVEADRVRISQVIHNLINNALKFTENGIIQVTAHSNLEKNLVEVAVRDSGSGIHPDILPNLFNKFVTRGPKTESWRGNGLGLYLCREIINAHGGHIFAYNNTESGATFKFTIPIMRRQNSREVQQKIMN